MTCVWIWKILDQIFGGFLVTFLRDYDIFLVVISPGFGIDTGNFLDPFWFRGCTFNSLTTPGTLVKYEKY